MKYININTGDITEAAKEDGIYAEAICVETNTMLALMPTTNAKAVLNGEIFDIKIPWNLYKKTFADADKSIKNTKILINSICAKNGIENIVSTQLFHHTTRCIEVKNKRYRYATRLETVKDGNIIEYPTKLDFDKSIKGEEFNFWSRNEAPAADSIITKEKVMLVSYSADCIICAIQDEFSGQVAVLHSMWRNMLRANGENGKNGCGNIIEETLFQMRSRGANMTRTKVFFFPCASAENYEIGRDVAEAFEKEGLSQAINKKEVSGETKYFLDLLESATILFRKNGIADENIEYCQYTTDDPEFCSLRNAGTGREYPAPPKSTDFLPDKPIGEKLSRQNAQNVLMVFKK